MVSYKTNAPWYQDLATRDNIVWSALAIEITCYSTNNAKSANDLQYWAKRAPNVTLFPVNPSITVSNVIKADLITQVGF